MNALRPALALALAALGLALAPGLRADDVAVAHGPRRVATLLPFVEDALRTAGADVVIVATIRRSLHVPVPEGTIDLGNPHSPSFERLAEARPDLVIGDSRIHARLAPQIERLGAEVLLIDANSVDTTFDELERVGEALDVAGAMRGAVEEARTDVSGAALDEPVPTLALFGTPGSFFAVTERTWLGDLMAQLNFENVGTNQAGDERHPGLVALSDEALAMLRPELVVLVAHGDPNAIQRAFDRKIQGGGAWQSVRESAAGNVHVLDGRLFNANPGLALPDAADALAALAEPDGE